MDSKPSKNSSPNKSKTSNQKTLIVLQKEELERKKARLNGSKKRRISEEIKKWKLISMYAEKGGVGKTTLTTTLGYCLAEKGKRVLMYDLDSQCSLTAWWFGKEINTEHGENLEEFINGVELDDGNVLSFYDEVFLEGQKLLEPIKPAQAVQVDLFLVVGNRETCMLDEKCLWDKLVWKHISI